MTRSIGVIGTGAIAAAIVDGLCVPPGESPEIFLSPRNARTANALADRHRGVHVCANNQEVVDNAALVLLTVRAEAVREALGQLRVPDDRILISAVAGLSAEELREQVDGNVTIVRAIPLPAVRQRRGITAVYPAHPSAEELFNRLGGALVAPDPATFDALSAATASISTYAHYLDTVADWVARQGVDTAEAERYVRSMFLGVDLADHHARLAELGQAHETPGGINEQLRTTWFNQQNRTALRQALDDIHQRIRPVD